MQMKDGASNITGDGTSLSGWCAATWESHQPEMCDLWRTLEHPIFPESWSQVVGGKSFD
jgi:hypothetical protein